MPTAAAATIQDVANELVTLCRTGRNMDAVETLYSPNIVSIEPFGDENMPARMTGIDAIRGKNQWWFENNEVHSAQLNGPFVGEGQFAVHGVYDVTAKQTGRRAVFSEMALYTVKNGKIVQEEFFYHIPS